MQDTTSIDRAGKPCGRLVSAGLRLAGSGGSRHAVLAVAAAMSDPEADMSTKALACHWACAKSAGSGWKAPPPGWDTYPDVSYDMGEPHVHLACSTQYTWSCTASATVCDARLA